MTSIANYNNPNLDEFSWDNGDATLAAADLDIALGLGLDFDPSGPAGVRPANAANAAMAPAPADSNNVYSSLSFGSNSTISSFNDPMSEAKDAAVNVFSEPSADPVNLAGLEPATTFQGSPASFNESHVGHVSRQSSFSWQFDDQVFTPTIDLPLYDIYDQHKSPRYDLGKPADYTSFDKPSTLVPIHENSEINVEDISRAVNEENIVDSEPHMGLNKNSFSNKFHRRYDSLPSLYNYQAKNNSYTVSSAVSTSSLLYSPASSVRSSMSSVSPAKSRNYSHARPQHVRASSSLASIDLPPVSAGSHLVLEHVGKNSPSCKTLQDDSSNSTINPKALDDDFGIASMKNSSSEGNLTNIYSLEVPDLYSKLSFDQLRGSDKIDFRMQGEAIDAIAQWLNQQEQEHSGSMLRQNKDIVHSKHVEPPEMFLSAETSQFPDIFAEDFAALSPNMFECNLDLPGDKNPDFSAKKPNLDASFNYDAAIASAAKRKHNKRRKRTKSEPSLAKFHNSTACVTSADSNRQRTHSVLSYNPILSANPIAAPDPDPKHSFDITNLNNISRPSTNAAKPFQCLKCEKSFRRQEHLKRHFRSVHSDERPFGCKHCDKKFSRSDNLAQHLRAHKR